jgi:hypothetical protein
MRFINRKFENFGSHSIWHLKERASASPKCGRPLQNQPPTAEEGFVEASPARVLRDGEGMLYFKPSLRLKFSALTFVLLLAAGNAGIAAAGPRVPAQKENSAKAAATAAVLTPDKGKFRIVLDGQVIGNEEFEISHSGETWMARGSTTAHAPGGTDIKATGQLKLSADGSPLRYEWSAEAQKKATGSVDFESGMAKCSASLGAASPLMKDFKFETPRIAVLDNNLYHQYAILARIYDWTAGGKQTFPVVIPQDLTPGSISVESIGPQQVEKANYEGMRVSSTDLEILLYLDANHHLVRLEVPSSKVIIQRE